jgi:GSH-dependent disulfide-bond oxidoreductase
LWQMGGLGPMLGQNHHFSRFAPERIAYATERYVNETKRLYAVLNKQLIGQDYVAGEYSIADMAILPWLLSYKWQSIDIQDYPEVARYIERLKARPAVEKALAIQIE